MSRPKAYCSFPDCREVHFGRGFCLGHYAQHRRGKELKPLFSRNRPNGTPPRIRYIEQPCSPEGIANGLTTPCHIWTGAKAGSGLYGIVGVRGKKMMMVHRYVWERDVGPISDGMYIDHLCKVHACCNVEHLRVVTPQINAIENNSGPIARQAAQTHCKRGHEFTPSNTYVYKRMRRCKTCKNERQNLRRAMIGR